MSGISNKELQLFNALHESRVTANKVFNQRAFRGIKPNVVDKYAETAHFVYELLQNADDANATEVTIILREDRLLFKHNGTKHFDITDDNDDPVGDINSITGIGNSSKENNQNKIGKFGVGFKAVFRYTDTPEIYDEPFKFKIEDLIVPTFIEHDHPVRKAGETLFVLPFRDPQKAFGEIKSRLETLKNPILFLRNLKKIVWHIETYDKHITTTEYSKTLLEKKVYKDITLEKYHLNNANREDDVFLFSRDITITLKDQTKTILPIYVGFYYDEENKCLKTTDTQNIYCFFPTKETFKTCFISHAPFLLTENRQNIKRDENLNTDLLSCIAYLASAAVVILRDYGLEHELYLINENIVDIIPLYPSRYYHSDEEMFEDPMEEAFKQLLEDEDILLSRNNNYLPVDHVYTTTKAIWDLLTQEQFYNVRSNGRELDEDDEISEAIDFLKWELIIKLDKLNDSKEIYSDIKSYSVEDLGNDISATFMESQKKDWVTKFYTFLRNDAPKYWKITPQTRNTAYVFRRAPIIKIQNGEWVAPFIDTTTPNVFLPIVNTSDSQSDYKFISQEYLQEDMALKFFMELEIKQPDETDYIRNSILKKYTEEEVDIEDDIIKADFLYLLSVYNKVKNTDQEEEYVKLVKDKLLLVCVDESLYKPTKLYLGLPLLTKYFEGIDDVNFFDYEYYKEHIGNAYSGQLINDFVRRLGVDADPVIIEETLYPHQFPVHVQEIAREYRYPDRFKDYKLHKFQEACTANNVTKEISVHLWNNVLPRFMEMLYSRLLYRKYRNGQNLFYAPQSPTSLLYELSTFKWIYDKEGRVHNAEELHLEDLALEYDLSNGITEVLNIQKLEQSMKDKYGATEEEDRQQQLGRELEAEADGVLTKEEMIAAIADAARKKRAAMQPEEQQEVPLDPEVENRVRKEMEKEEKQRRLRDKEKVKLDKLKKDADAEDLPRHHQTDYSTAQLFDTPADNPTASPRNREETSSVLTEEEIWQMQEQDNARKSLIAIAEDESKKYTFEWFNALLELEFEASDESSRSSRGINLVFSKVEKDPNSERGVLLRNPSQYIPRALEEMENISVTFYLPDNMHMTVSFEVASVQDYILRLKCKNEDVEQISDLLQVAHRIYRAEIKTSSPIKLISELQNAFRALNYAPNYSLLDNLNPEIKFVFGPPGTGKTTHLVKKWINKVATTPHAKMLILCPTNKAADVIARRALDNINSRSCPENWLYRFVATADDTLESHVCTRDSNLHEQQKCCVISTIARFAYDGFEGAKLKDIDWDYIIIDEASMIPLAEIIYPLFRCRESQIVIAGDPFQIEPIVSEERWKDENIYKMVHLNNFSNPKTVPVKFDIVNLPVQYRAVPAIGRLFSEYAYNGGVSSNREQESQRKLTIKNYDVKSVNFVMFPVDNFSIFEPHNIGNSPIHIYSALFTFEFVKYIAKNIDGMQDEKSWRIGVISPYRAQAEIINKLWEQRTELYDNVDVSIGTVHGFQGDECDIIIAVYNPPVYGLKRAADRTFINKKNILNVAISRAQDYLFILMPDREFAHYDKLEAKTIGNIAMKEPDEMTTTTSQKVEKVMFGDVHFLEKNTFVTTHQIANVYTSPASLYEVRFDDKSVDVQIQ